MNIAIVPFESAVAPRVKEFNDRLRCRAAGFEFPAHPTAVDFPKSSDDRIYQECFVALDGDTVRGGYILKTQECALAGRRRAIGNYQLPLSEGIVDQRHAMVGVQLLFDAIRRQPYLYSLGMGSLSRPLPRMLAKMGWRVSLVPFYFRILHPHKFLTNIAFLRGRPAVRVGLDVLNWSGLGWAGLKAWKLTSALPGRFLARDAECAKCPDFGNWATEIWTASQAQFQFANVRDSQTLGVLYPSGSPGFIRLRVFVGAETVGWALVMATRMKGHKQFGNMFVGSLVDGCALSGFEAAVVVRATRYLESLGVDLVVSNQSHHSWQRGLRRAGFCRGPSNFAFACSPKLSQEISDLGHCHINRGDGDGPIHL